MTETSTTERTAELMRELLERVTQRKTNEMLRVRAEMGLSIPQMVALHILHDCNTLSISAIADKLDLSLAAGSHLVDRLVQQQLVVRLEDPLDRRHKRVSIAPGGQAVLDRLAEARMREVDLIVAALPPELNTQLSQVLEQVLGQLEA